MPVLAIPHGGGPCFFMDSPPPFPPTMWNELRDYLQRVGATLAPWTRAILIISGHWDARRPTVNTAGAHSLFFDYYGFPAHTYRLSYPAKGDPALAARVRSLLQAASIEFDEESSRGLDHGVFVPLLVMFPRADIPLVQLSLRSDMDPQAHLDIGRALASLRDEGVLIIGSGNSYHNVGQFLVLNRAAAEAGRLFNEWLDAAFTDPDPAQRNQKLAAWRSAPGALASHPTPDHLLPYHVAAGAAEDDVATRDFHGMILDKILSGYRFG